MAGDNEEKGRELQLFFDDLTLDDSIELAFCDELH
jgi:hypothetical protein